MKPAKPVDRWPIARGKRSSTLALSAAELEQKRKLRDDLAAAVQRFVDAGGQIERPAMGAVAPEKPKVKRGVAAKGDANE